MKKSIRLLAVLLTAGIGLTSCQFLPERGSEAEVSSSVGSSESSQVESLESASGTWKENGTPTPVGEIITVENTGWETAIVESELQWLPVPSEYLSPENLKMYGDRLYVTDSYSGFDDGKDLAITAYSVPDMNVVGSVKKDNSWDCDYIGPDKIMISKMNDRAEILAYDEYDRDLNLVATHELPGGADTPDGLFCVYLPKENSFVYTSTGGFDDRYSYLNIWDLSEPIVNTAGRDISGDTCYFRELQAGERDNLLFYTTMPWEANTTEETFSIYDIQSEVDVVVPKNRKTSDSRKYMFDAYYSSVFDYNENSMGGFMQAPFSSGQGRIVCPAYEGHILATGSMATGSLTDIALINPVSKQIRVTRQDEILIPQTVQVLGKDKVLLLANKDGKQTPCILTFSDKLADNQPEGIDFSPQSLNRLVGKAIPITSRYYQVEESGAKNRQTTLSVVSQAIYTATEAYHTLFWDEERSSEPGMMETIALEGLITMGGSNMDAEAEQYRESEGDEGYSYDYYNIPYDRFDAMLKKLFPNAKDSASKKSLSIDPETENFRITRNEGRFFSDEMLLTDASWDESASVLTLKVQFKNGNGMLPPEQTKTVDAEIAVSVDAETGTFAYQSLSFTEQE